MFRRLGHYSRGTRSFYEELRNRDNDVDIEEEAGLRLDEENLRHDFGGVEPEHIVDGDSRISVENADGRDTGVMAAAPSQIRRERPSRWGSEDDADNDVPESLLIEHNGDNLRPPVRITNLMADPTQASPRGASVPVPSPAKSRAQWEAATSQQRLHRDEPHSRRSRLQMRSVMEGVVVGGHREKALWRWVNTSNLDSFMRDVYDYYEGGGLWCILCSNALWLLETLFVAVLLTFMGQCVDYSTVPQSKSLSQVIIPQCTRKMSGLWNLGIWMYSFFFIWKCVQYFLEIRRLVHVREFFFYLLEIPEQDMQTVSWQDVVARIMALRDQNPKTATNIPASVRRFMGSQSKDRLDAHDIANRLMRKENYLIAMINKDVLDLTLPLPFLRGRLLFSKTMEWYLHYGILDMAFNEFGQVQQDFLRADRRGVLSQKMKQRLIFAGILNLIFAPVVLAYVIIVYFFTYYNEYQRDPKMAAARKYTALAEWKFREFNELPHIFYERLHMSYPFATRYVDQFPKRMTEDIARSISFMAGAITAILAIGTVMDSELFLSFEITKDRTVLFYLGIFGAIWAITRGMVSEDAAVFNPEYAMRNVIEYTHYAPDHWQGRLHSFEVKREFAELYKMKVIIFLEEVMGIITTPLLLLFALPKCSDQIVDFFREFTVHVDGLGYVCSFAVFDFKKGLGNTGRQGGTRDMRDDYYSTKHGKMAASFYGFIDNYMINPKTGIPGHIMPGTRQHHTPPAFPGLTSPSFPDMQESVSGGRGETSRARSRGPDMGPKPARRVGPGTIPLSPMASALLDPRHQPHNAKLGARSVHRSRYQREHRDEPQTIEETLEDDSPARTARAEGEGSGEATGILGESTWETSPGQGFSRENSAAHAEEPESGVLGLITQLRQTQYNRRGGVV